MKKKLIEGPLGFPMPEKLAREVEALMKSLPKDSAYRYRKAAGVPSAVELVKGEKADISLISSDAIDRDGEVVLPKGVDLNYFVKNPIVTFAHKYDELPVSKAQWVKRVEGGIKAKTVYTDAHEVARACWQMTQEGILKGKSIGFLPTKIRPPSSDELEYRPELKNANAIIETAVLLEYAVAPIPVNQDALVEAVAKGYADEATLKRMGLKVSSGTRTKAMNNNQVDLATLLDALTAISIDPARVADLVEKRMRERGRV
jgi:hypothetical protein